MASATYYFDEEVVFMIITNTYISQNDNERVNRQAELHRKCILILQTSTDKG